VLWVPFEPISLSEVTGDRSPDSAGWIYFYFYFETNERTFHSRERPKHTTPNQWRPGGKRHKVTGNQRKTKDPYTPKHTNHRNRPALRLWCRHLAFASLADLRRLDFSQCKYLAWSEKKRQFPKSTVTAVDASKVEVGPTWVLAAHSTDSTAGTVMQAACNGSAPLTSNPLLQHVGSSPWHFTEPE
jgi:hypothetical protein